MSALTQRQLWGHIALGMQQDIAAYASLQTLLQTQFHAALRHDAQAMQEVAQHISAQADALEQARQTRVAHVQAVLPAGARASMTQAIAQLQGPLQQQLMDMWQRLQTQVQTCKALNVRNCQLIMEQAQIMQQVIGVPREQEGIYAPR